MPSRTLEYRLLAPRQLTGKSAHDVVQGFTKIGCFQNGKLTLRQLSARVFWGHSKVLDTREDAAAVVSGD